MVFEKENKGPTMEIRKRKEENRIGNNQVDESKSDKKDENGDDMIVTLSPMEIRAFIMEVTY